MPHPILLAPGEKREEERRGAAAAKVASHQRRVRQLRPRLIRPCGGGRERDVDGRKRKTLQGSRFHRLHCGCDKIENGKWAGRRDNSDELTHVLRIAGEMIADHYKFIFSVRRQENTNNSLCGVCHERDASSGGVIVLPLRP